MLRTATLDVPYVFSEIHSVMFQSSQGVGKILKRTR